MIFENESDLKFEIINDRNLFLVEGLKEFDKKYTLNYGENGYDIFGFDYFGYDKEGFNNKGYNEDGHTKEYFNIKGYYK